MTTTNEAGAAAGALDHATRAYYQDNATVAFVRMLEADSSALYPPFLVHVPPGGHVLDAGCGAGRDSRYFLAQGYQVTALDASERMAALAAAHIGQPVLRMAFQDVAFESCFDAIWASASLLHVPKREIGDVLGRLSRALKPRGVLYASFMYGEGEGTRGGLLFNYYTEPSLREELANHQELNPLRMWQTTDLPPARQDVRWLHVLVQKR